MVLLQHHNKSGIRNLTVACVSRDSTLRWDTVLFWCTRTDNMDQGGDDKQAGKIFNAENCP